jgi:NAD(P)-dependent dehydrogenase (short-subunit alcohol dehydrogenase family)
MVSLGAKSTAPVAIVTGASRGIGLETARALVGDGFAVCMTARDGKALEQSRAALADAGADVIAIAGASQDSEHEAEVVRSVLQRWERIDVLVNNAGMSPFIGDLLDAEPQHLDKAWAVNVAAPWAWCRRVVKEYMGEHGGAIVNMASIGGTYPVPRVGVYNVSKAALIHMTRQLALELAPRVRVNAVAPATIKTDFARPKYEGREQEVADQYPLRRLGAPEEVAEVVAMLSNGKLGWITGQTFVLDGGASLIQGVV